ncbi:MAG: GAF domain-containing protein [Anaerolineae bacterium]
MNPLTERLPGLSPSARRTFDRFWAVAGAVSVRTKILGIVLALVLVLGTGVTLQVRSTVRAALSHELNDRGVSITRDVAARSVDMLLTRDLYGVYQLLQDTLANNDDVRYAFIVSPQGEILVHTFGDRFPLDLVGVNRVDAGERYHLRRIATEDGVIWDFAVPVFSGQAGVARVGLSEQSMQTTLADVTRQLMVTTGVVSLVGVAAAMFLTWLITRPVLDLVEVTWAVARGDLSHQAPHWADDEIGLLSDSLNAMIGDLESTRAESEAFNAELLHRNRELAVLNEVARSVSRQQDLDGMLDNALRRVLDLMNLKAGWILLLEANGAKPRVVCSVDIPAGVTRQEEQEGFPHCQCGTLIEERRPLVITPLDETCPMYGLRLADGRVVGGHAAVPLVSKSRVLGTLNIACASFDCLSDQELQLLGAIGRQLGVAVENARLWKEVRQKEAARGQLLEKIITAQEEERKRIARELHDGASQSLTSLMVGLKVLAGLRSPDEISQHLSSLRDVVAETLETVHDMALELRPSLLDDMGLVAALDRYVVEYQRRFDIRVDSRAVGFEGRRLPPHIETTLYRIVQEALTNVARHSGAQHASVLLEWTGHHVRAIVEDNGRGFDVSLAGQERKLGLYGMEERATLIGGRLRIESQPDEGTTIVADVPMAATSGTLRKIV